MCQRRFSGWSFTFPPAIFTKKSITTNMYIGTVVPDIKHINLCRWPWGPKWPPIQRTSRVSSPTGMPWSKHGNVEVLEKVKVLRIEVLYVHDYMYFPYVYICMYMFFVYIHTDLDLYVQYCSRILCQACSIIITGTFLRWSSTFIYSNCNVPPFAAEISSVETPNVH